MHEEDDLEACNFTMMGFKTVMEAMRACGVRRIAWASTSAVYEGNPVPYYEGMILEPPDSKAAASTGAKWKLGDTPTATDSSLLLCGHSPFTAWANIPRAATPTLPRF